MGAISWGSNLDGRLQFYGHVDNLHVRWLQRRMRRAYGGCIVGANGLLLLLLLPPAMPSVLLFFGGGVHHMQARGGREGRHGVRAARRGGRPDRGWS
jgi:hypothetical protein